MTKTELQQEALDRAQNGMSEANYLAIYMGFEAKGISRSDITPRENVLTFNAWKAKGRSVMKGQHGVRVETMAPVTIAECGNCAAAGRACGNHGIHPRTAVVFHISQTEPTEEAEARWARNADQKASGGYRKTNGKRSNWIKFNKPRDDSWKSDPGELAADRWNETHGDRWTEE